MYSEKMSLTIIMINKFHFVIFPDKGIGMHFTITECLFLNNPYAHIHMFRALGP